MKFDRPLFNSALTKSWQTLNLAAQEPPPHFDLHWFESLPSTNQKVWSLLEQGASGGTVAIAAEQQAGRGQWGRQWQSPPGGLYLSLALAPNLAVANSGQLTLCSAWGIAQALRHYHLPVELKWPNDLVVNKRKLGGILIETRLQQTRIASAVIGVGINWANPTPPSGINLQTVQSQLSTEPGDRFISSLEALAAVTLNGIMVGYRYWQHHGIDALLPSYQKLLTSLGAPIVVNNQAGQIAGISAQGELRVQLNPSDDQKTPAPEVCLKPGEISLGYGES